MDVSRYGGNDKLNLFLLGAFLVLIVIAALLQLEFWTFQPFWFSSTHITAFSPKTLRHELLKSEVRAWPGKSFWHISKSGEKERAENLSNFSVSSVRSKAAHSKRSRQGERHLSKMPQRIYETELNHSNVRVYTHSKTRVKVSGIR